MKLRRRVIGFIRFETTYFPYLQEQRFPLDLEDEESSLPWISWTDYSVTRRQVGEKYLELHPCENLKTHTFSLTQKVNCPSIACCHERYLSPFLGAFVKFRKSTISFVMSVRLSAWNNLAATGRIFVKLYTWRFFETVQKIQVSLKPDKNNGYFTRRPIYIFIISR